MSLLSVFHPHQVRPLISGKQRASCHNGDKFRLCDIRTVKPACHYVETMNILASWAALGSLTVQNGKGYTGR